MFFAIFIFVCILSIIVNKQAIFLYFTNTHKSFISTICAKYPQYKKYNNPSLSMILSKSLKDVKGLYGIAVKHFITGETYYYNQDKVFSTASLYKVWIMAMTYERIKNGTLQLSTSLSGDLTELLEEMGVSPELAQQQEGTITYSVEEAINKMITISDNNSALLLTHVLKQSAVPEFLKRYNYLKSMGGNGFPTSTPDDMLMFFEDLYREKLIDKKYSKMMVDILKEQELNYFLPARLPKDVTIAHKTGELNTVSNDAGIVFAEGGPYGIVIFTDSGDPSGAVNRGAQISKIVYDYFQNDYVRRVENKKIEQQAEFISKIVYVGMVILIIVTIVVLIRFVYVIISKYK